MNNENQKAIRKAAALYGHYQAAREVGNLDDALRKLDQSLYLLPDDAILLAVRANTLFAMERYEEAHVSAIKSVMLDPHGSHAWLVFAYLAELDGEFEAASLYFEKMTKIDPAVHNFTLLAAAQRQFDEEKAKISISRALEIDDTWEEALAIAKKLGVGPKD